MSAYIVNKETIDVIVQGFERYGLRFCAEGYEEPRSIIINKRDINNAIGQALLNQNFKSVNARYKEDSEPYDYNYTEVEMDEGMLLGCIECYEYQACETEDYFESLLHDSLLNLKIYMLKRFIRQAGQEIPWGYQYKK